MCTLYILHSKTLNKYYTGITTGDVQSRIIKHNTTAYGNHRFTAAAKDWTLYLKIECESNSQARKIELHIKSMKSKIYIENLLKYPELKNKLLEQTA